MWVRPATALLMRWLTAPATALMSAFCSGAGRVSSGARSAASAPTALSPFGRKAKAQSFKSRM
eukprot:5317390-Pyramimonas_sp.AAC.1